MNRRNFLITSGAAAAVAATPLHAAMLKSSRIMFHGRSARNRHAPLVSEWAAKLMAARHIYTRNEFMGDKIKLEDPLFRVFEGPLSVEPKGMVWNWMTGYTDEIGLAVYVLEHGVPIGATGIATSIGYEDYFTTLERDHERFPDYFVRSITLEYAGRQIIEPKLPKGHITMDDRWFEQMMKKKEQA